MSPYDIRTQFRVDYGLPYECVSGRCVKAAISASNSVHHQLRLVADCSAEWGYPNNETQSMAQHQSWALMEKPPRHFLSFTLGFLMERNCDKALRRTCSSVTDLAIQVKLVVAENWFYATSFRDLRVSYPGIVARSMLFVADFLFVTPLCLLFNCMAMVLIRRVLKVGVSLIKFDQD